ncbi:hypothetical protein AB4K20DRAFT_1876199 [Rhizopus microsporus]
MSSNGLLLLYYFISNKEGLQINHILQVIYFKYSAAQLRNYSELSSIAVNFPQIKHGILLKQNDNIKGT